jgi:trimeric autotransporter adhesin
LHATVQTGGTWNVTPSPLVNGAHTVGVSVADAATNIGGATQALTVDTVLPVITINGGSTATTADPTPTISGTTDAAVGTIVTVAGAGVAMASLVQNGGSWNATPASSLADATYTVLVSLADPAGNVGVTTQSLTISFNASTTTTTTTIPPTTTTVPVVAVPVVNPVTAPVFAAVTAMRLFDTRTGESLDAIRSVPKHKVGGADEIEVSVVGIDDVVPAIGVGAVSLNITVTNAENDGFITVYACGTREQVSSVNYVSGQTVANAVLAPVSPSGTICIYSSAPTDLVADINGWFPLGAVFTPVGPKRVFDTRADQLQPTLRSVSKVAIRADSSLEVHLTDLPGLVPEQGVGSVSLNVTVTGATGAGFITVYDCVARALVSSVNFVAGDTVANAVLAPVSASGDVCFYSSATTDLVVDINGWLSSGSSFTAVSPRRLLDTRPGQSSTSLRAVSSRQVGGEYVLEVKITDLPGVVPASNVGAVSLNVTATGAGGPGYVTVYPCGVRREVSSLNYGTDQTVANAVVARLSPAGTICIYAQTPVDIVVDFNGWFSHSG